VFLKASHGKEVTSSYVPICLAYFSGLIALFSFYLFCTSGTVFLILLDRPLVLVSLYCQLHEIYKNFIINLFMKVTGFVFHLAGTGLEWLTLFYYYLVYCPLYYILLLFYLTENIVVITVLSIIYPFILNICLFVS
jgi:hypothetical protein